MTHWKYIYDNQSEKFTKSSHKISNDLLDDEAIITPLRVGICGTDIKQLVHKIEDKRIGHEWVGVIEKIGNSKSDYSVGEIVVSVAHIRCCKCQTCHDGSSEPCLQPQLLGEGDNNVLSSSIKLKISDLLKVPQKLSLEDICLFEVAFIGDTALERAQLIGLEKEDTCLVLGAGPIGIFTALALKHRGYEVKITDKNTNRVAIAKKAGIETLLYAQLLIDPSFRSNYECVFDCTGDNHGEGALPLAPSFVKPRHKLVIVGKYLDAQMSEKHYGGKALRVTWVSHHEKRIFLETIEFWKDLISQYTPLFTQTYPIEDINNAFNDALEAKTVKCIIKVNEYEGKS